MTKRAALTVCLLILAGSLLSCENTIEHQKKITQTFASFDNSEQYILLTAYEIHIGKRVIDLDSITYNGEPCHMILTDAEGVYAYSYEPEPETSFSILYVDYETLTPTLLTTVPWDDSIIAAEHFNNSLCFRTYDRQSEGQIYLVYDLSTGEISTVDTDDADYCDIEESGDHNRSSVYTIIGKAEWMENTLRVTKKETGETKVLDNSLLKTCAEGRAIIEMGSRDLGNGCSPAYEKDGDIYVVYAYITDGFLGSPCHFYVMKYDFDNHALEYYTSVFFEEYPESVYDLYIP